MNFDSALMGVLSLYSPEKLTDILYKENILRRGKVLDVHKKVKITTFVSFIFDISLEFSSNILLKQGKGFDKMLLKVCRKNNDTTDFMRETEFYNRISKMSEVSVAPLCFDSKYYEGYEMYGILMENLHGSHICLQDTYPLLPAHSQCENVIKTLADFHAGWWEDVRLHNLVKKSNIESIESESFMRETYREFAVFMKDWLNESTNRL